LWNPRDWFYTCETHLTDPGFATLVIEDPASASMQRQALSGVELAKITEEWQNKKDAAATPDKGTEMEKVPKPENGKLPVQPPQSPNAQPTHQKYTLHRKIFDMRVQAFKKREQASQAKAVAPRLPLVPTGRV